MLMILLSLCELSVLGIDLKALISCPSSDEEISFAWSARKWWRDGARLVFLVVGLAPSIYLPSFNATSRTVIPHLP
jgi:hypothetical protein